MNFGQSNMYHFSAWRMQHSGSCKSTQRRKNTIIGLGGGVSKMFKQAESESNYSEPPHVYIRVYSQM